MSAVITTEPSIELETGSPPDLPPIDDDDRDEGPGDDNHDYGRDPELRKGVNNWLMPLDMGGQAGAESVGQDVLPIVFSLKPIESIYLTGVHFPKSITDSYSGEVRRELKWQLSERNPEFSLVEQKIRLRAMQSDLNEYLEIPKSKFLKMLNNHSFVELLVERTLYWQQRGQENRAAFEAYSQLDDDQNVHAAVLTQLERRFGDKITPHLHKLKLNPAGAKTPGNPTGRTDCFLTEGPPDHLRDKPEYRDRPEGYTIILAGTLKYAAWLTPDNFVQQPDSDSAFLRMPALDQRQYLENLSDFLSEEIAEAAAEEVEAEIHTSGYHEIEYEGASIYPEQLTISSDEFSDWFEDYPNAAEVLESVPAEILAQVRGVSRVSASGYVDEYSSVRGDLALIVKPQRLKIEGGSIRVEAALDYDDSDLELEW